VTAAEKSTGFINTGGLAAGHTLNLTATNFIGGTASLASCLYLNAINNPTVVITGHSKGGSGQSSHGTNILQAQTVSISNGAEGGPGAGETAYGVYCYYGTVTITGDITAGAGTLAHGLFTAGTGTSVLVNSNLINSATALAISGEPPTWNPGTTYYWQMTTDSATHYFFGVDTSSYPASGGGGAWAN
jgi:hypothetical protein